MLFTRPLRFHTSNEVAQLSIGQIPLLVHQGGEPVLERLQIRPELNHVAPAGAVLAILQGRTEGHEPGSVDWSHEVLSWY